MAAGKPLIVGAGPTGLAAALFLLHHGIAARIVDAAPEPSPWSKALAVNPRTLELLEPTGVSARMIAEGRPIDRAIMHRDWSSDLATIDVRSIHPRFQMTALSQARSEALLAEALAERGIEVERAVKLVGLADRGSVVEASLVGPDGAGEEVACPLVLGADGAHSPTRHALGLDFPGSAFPEPWPLFDVRMETDLALDAAHIGLFDDGLMFCLAFGPGHWRVLGNFPDPLGRLPAGSRVDEILWQSSFRISHRVASAAQVGLVALGGDAAHIHSPLGARGMNLGIEDAYVFAACAADALAGRSGRLADYGRLREPVHRSVVKRIKLLTTVARGRSATVRRVRNLVLPVATRLPFVGPTVVRTMTGLDHEPAVT